MLNNTIEAAKAALPTSAIGGATGAMLFGLGEILGSQEIYAKKVAASTALGFAAGAVLFQAGGMLWYMSKRGTRVMFTPIVAGTAAGAGMGYTALRKGERSSRELLKRGAYLGLFGGLAGGIGDLGLHFFRK